MYTSNKLTKITFKKQTHKINNAVKQMHQGGGRGRDNKNHVWTSKIRTFVRTNHTGNIVRAVETALQDTPPTRQAPGTRSAIQPCSMSESRRAPLKPVAKRTNNRTVMGPKFFAAEQKGFGQYLFERHQADQPHSSKISGSSNAKFTGRD